jgi:hypothetical protein
MDTGNRITRTSNAPGNNQDQARDDHFFAPQARTGRDMTHIRGWGADLDRKDRPAVPMEHTPPRLEGAPIATPSQQRERVEVFVSPERPGITPLFGTSAPPKGISGMLRRMAYKMTENDIRHFVLLLLADRVNVVEGVAEDLMEGRVPNVFGEMGIKAEWEHNRAGLVKKAAVATAIVGIGYYLLKQRESNR